MHWEAQLQKGPTRRYLTVALALILVSASLAVKAASDASRNTKPARAPAKADTNRCERIQEQLDALREQFRTGYKLRESNRLKAREDELQAEQRRLCR